MKRKRTPEKKNKFAEDAGRWVFLIVGSSLIAFNIASFVRSAGLFPSGFAGISLLMQQVCQRYWGFTPPYSLFSLTLNFLAASLCFRYIGRRFAILSMAAVIITSLLTDILPTITIADNQLLCSVFGGLINGFAINLCLRADASTGGTDFISIYLSEKHGRDEFDVILGMNVVILTTAGILFGVERAMYSIIYQFFTTQSLHALFRRYQHRTLWIITEIPDEVYEIIRSDTHHGATLFKGVGLYKNEPRSMIYTVVSGDDVRRVVHDIRTADPQAFINAQHTDSLVGRFYIKPQR